MVCSFWEEIKRMLNNKMILIILFVIPIATNILIGFEFQGSQIRHIPMAVVDHDGTALSRLILQQFRESDTFSVKYVLEEDEELKHLIDSGKAKVGMIIPPAFSQDVTKLRSPGILMLYDGSHLSIASTAKSKASEILLTLKTGISMKLIGGKLSLPKALTAKAAQTVRFNSRYLYNPARSYRDFLNPGLGTAVVQTAIVLLGAVCIRKEKLNGSINRNIRYVTGKIAFYAMGGTMSFMSSILIQSSFFHVPFRGNISYALFLSLMMSISVAAFSVMVSVWIEDQMLTSFLAALLFIPSTALAGYTWPALSMPELYRRLAFLMPFNHYGQPLRELYLKGIPFTSLLADLQWFGCFTLVSLAAAYMGAIRQSLRMPVSIPVIESYSASYVEEE